MVTKHERWVWVGLDERGAVRYLDVGERRPSKHSAGDLTLVRVTGAAAAAASLAFDELPPFVTAADGGFTVTYGAEVRGW